MRLITAVVVCLLAVGCASSQPDGTSPAEETPEECDGVWLIQVTNHLTEQVHVTYDSWKGRWWLGVVYPNETKNLLLSPDETEWTGRTPHVHVESETTDDHWCNDPRKTHIQYRARNSLNLEVTIRCRHEGDAPSFLEILKPIAFEKPTYPR